MGLKWKVGISSKDVAMAQGCLSLRAKGTRAVGMAGEERSLPALTGWEHEHSLKLAARKKRNLSPGSVCCLFMYIARYPFSLLSRRKSQHL